MSNWRGTKSWNRGQRVEKEFTKLLKKRDPNYKKQIEKINFATLITTQVLVQ